MSLAGAALALLSIGALGLALATPIVGGIGWDGPYEVELGALLLQTTSDPASLAELRQAWAPQDLSKGPLLFWLAQLIGIASPLPSWTGMVADHNNYVLLGVSSVSLGLVGIGILSGSLAYALRSRMVGMLTVSLVLTLPLWTGLSALDYRDTQVASGIAALTGAGLLAISSKNSRWSIALITSFAAIGSLFAIGSRSGSVLLVGALSVWIAAVVLIIQRHEMRIAFLKTTALFGGVLLGTALAVLSHPLGRADPIQWLSEAVRLASDHPNVMLVRVLGRNITSNESPWWYVPAWLGAQLPLATLLTFVTAAICFVVLKPRSLRESITAHPAVLLIGPAALIPLAVVASGPNLFDGIRHLLFLVPPLFALVITIAWSLIGRRLPPTRVTRKVGRGLVTWTFIAVISLSLFASARWFPYSYAFVNPVAGAIKEPRIWEYDYWGISVREAISKLRSQGVERVFVRPSAQSGIAFGGEEFDAYLEDPTGNWGGVTFYRWDSDLPDACQTTVTITRDGIPLAKAGSCRDQP